MRTKSKVEKAYAKNLGAWIHDKRTELGLSLEAFGEQIGVHRNTVWMWESGQTMPNVYQYSLIRQQVNGVEVAQ
jgi:transcriptional regulator with XRE-family HTH domain